jgi:hypothetical protein
MEYQLKILYEFNQPEDFDLIIVDNSEPTEKDLLDDLAKKYTSYNNLSIIYNNSNSADFKSRTSSQHGEGLNIILNKSNSKYLLVHDPDFFWVKKDYLKLMEQELENGALVIGAPYSVPIKTGAANFPSAFGCAYNLLKVKEDGLNFDAGINDEEKVKEHKYPGWQMRAKYSDQKFISFEQKVSILPFIFGHHSYNSVPRYYIFNGDIIGYHLFRGSFVADSESHVKNAHLIDVPELYRDSRYLYSQYFYCVIAGKKFSILKYKTFSNVIKNAFCLLFRKSPDGSKSPYRFAKTIKLLIRNRVFA